MGMSMHVEGVVRPNDEWAKMKTVYDACVAARVAIPSEVREYFDYKAPDVAGRCVLLGTFGSPKEAPCVREFTSEGVQGLEVQLDTLPPGLASIRFFCSW